MRTKNGTRFGLFTKNFLIRDKDSGDNIKNNEYGAYVFNNNQINEIDFGEFFEKYQENLHDIYDYFSNEKKNIKNKYYNASIGKYGDIDEFEIYLVKY